MAKRRLVRAVGYLARRVGAPGVTHAASAAQQLNGLVLLHSYQQRLFVYDAVAANLAGVELTEPTGELAAQIDELSAVTANFDTVHGLTAAQQETATRLIDQARPLIVTKLLEGDESRAHQLGVVAAAFHGDMHVNQGLIALAQTYDPGLVEAITEEGNELGERVGVINYLIGKLVAQEELSDEEGSALASWFGQINEADVADVDTDLDQIRKMIVGHSS